MDMNTFKLNFTKTQKKTIVNTTTGILRRPFRLMLRRRNSDFMYIKLAKRTIGTTINSGRLFTSKLTGFERAHSEVMNIPATLKQRLATAILEAAGIRERIAGLSMANLINNMLTTILMTTNIAMHRDWKTIAVNIPGIISNLIMAAFNIYAAVKTTGSTDERNKSTIEQIVTTLTNNFITSTFTAEGIKLDVDERISNVMEFLKLDNPRSIMEFVKKTEQLKVDDSTNTISPNDYMSADMYEHVCQSRRTIMGSKSNSYAVHNAKEVIAHVRKLDHLVRDVTFKPEQTSTRGNMCLYHALYGTQSNGQLTFGDTDALLADFSTKVELAYNEGDETIKSTIRLALTEQWEMFKLGDEFDIKRFCETWRVRKQMQSIEICSLLATFSKTNIVVIVGDKPHIYRPLFETVHKIQEPLGSVIRLEADHFSRVSIQQLDKSITGYEACVKICKIIKLHSAEDDLAAMVAINEICNHVNTLRTMGTISLAHALTAETGTKLGVGLVSMVIMIAGMCTTDGTFSAKLTSGRTMAKTFKDGMTEAGSLVKDLAFECFGMVLSSDTFNATLLLTDLANAEKYAKYEAHEFVENIALYYEAKEVVASTHDRLHHLRMNTKDLDAGYYNTEKTLRAVLHKVTTNLTEAARTLSNRDIRVDPVVVNIFGAKGANKTTFISGTLIPQLHKLCGFDSRTYNLNFTKSDQFAPYRGEKITFYDEWGLKGKDEPLLPYFTSMASGNAFNAQGAALNTKETPYASEFMILASNSSYFSTGYGDESESAVFGRMLPIHFVNTRQTSDMSRLDVPYVDLKDNTTYELRVYTRQIDSTWTPTLYSSATPGSIRHYNAEDDKYDDTLYGPNNRQYRLMTVRQLITDLKERHAIRLDYYHQRNEELCQVAVQSLSTKGLTREQIQAACLSRGFRLDHIVKSMGSAIHGDGKVIDNYVVSLFGKPGTGKSTFADSVALKLWRVTRMPIYQVIKPADFEKVPTGRPCIVVIHDQIYDELNYVNFYDSLTKPSIIITTSNHVIGKKTGPSINIQELGGEPSAASPSRMRVLWDTVFNKLYDFRQVNKWTIGSFDERPQPGFTRRLGFCGTSEHAGSDGQRAVGTGMILETRSGYMTHIQELESSELGPLVSVKTVVEKILTDFSVYNKTQNVEIVHTQSSTIDELVTKHGIDVHIEAPTLAELIAMTHDTMALITLAMGRTKSGHCVSITDRVRTATFVYNPLDFKIPTDATLNDVREIAIQRYRTLMNGGRDFSIYVRCKEFTVYGRNGILYSTHMAPDTQQKYVYEFVNDDFILSTGGETRDVVATLTKNELIEYLNEGFEFNPTGPLNLDVIEWLSDNARIILGEVEMKPAVELYNTHHAVYDSVKHEKNAFTTAFAIIQTTWWYKLAVGLLVLIAVSTTFSFIGMIVSWIRGLFGKPEQVLRVEYKDRPLPLLVEFDGNTKKNNVRAYIIEHTFDDVSRDELRKYISGQYQQYNGYVKTMEDDANEETLPLIGEIIIDEVNYERLEQRKDIPSRIKNILRVTRKVKDIHQSSKGSIYENERKTRDHTSKKNIARIVRAVKPNGNNNNDGHGIDSIIFKSIVQMCASGIVIKDGVPISREFRVVGTKVADKYILSSLHLIRAMPKYDSLYMTDVNGTVCEVELVVSDAGRDIGIYKIVDKTYPSSRSLIKHFHKSAKQYFNARALKHSFSSNVNYILPGTGRSYINTIDYDFGGICRIDSGSAITQATLTEVRSSKLGPGDCGTLILNDADDEIVGMYFSRTGDGNDSSVYVNVSRDLITRLIDAAENEDGMDEELIFFDANEELVETDETLETVCESASFNIPYKDGLEEVNTSVWTASILDAASESEVYTYYPDIADGEHTSLIGYVPIGSTSKNLKHKYLRTPYANRVDKLIPIVMANSALTLPEIEDTSGLVTATNGQQSILLTQTNYINDPIDVEGEVVGRDCLNTARKMVSKLYKQWYGDFKHRPLTYYELYNGLQINPNDALYGCLEMINLDGSTGIEMASKFNVNNFRQLLGKIDVKTASGRDLYVPRMEDPATHYLTGEIINSLDFWKQGRRYESIVKSNLKTELRPLAKVAAGKTRQFESFPCSTFLAMRKLFGTFIAANKKRRGVGSCQTGADVVDFNSMLERMSRVGLNMEDGDFEAWDKHMMEYSSEAAMDVIADVLIGSSTFYKYDMTPQEMRNTCRMVSKANIRALCIADHQIITANRGSKSGFVLTTVVNSLVNMLLRYACCVFLIRKHNEMLRNGNDARQYWLDILIEHETPKHLIDRVMRTNYTTSLVPCTAEFISANMIYLTMGDDANAAYSDDVAFMFNFVTMKLAYRYLYGMNYDSPNKDGSIRAFTPIQEMSFCSRTLYKDPQLNVVTPRLKLSSIHRLLHFSTSVTPDQLKTNLDMVFGEIILHERSEYELVVKVVNDYINPYFRWTYGHTACYMIPDYDERRVAFLESVKFGNNRSTLQFDPEMEIEGIDFNESINEITKGNGTRHLLTNENNTSNERTLQIHCDSIEKMNCTPNKTNATLLMRGIEQNEEIRATFGNRLKKAGEPAFIHDVDQPSSGTWSMSFEHGLKQGVMPYAIDVRKRLQRFVANLTFTFVSFQMLTIWVAGTAKTRVQFQFKERLPMVPPVAELEHPVRSSKNTKTKRELKPHTGEDVTLAPGTMNMPSQAYAPAMADPNLQGPALDGTPATLNMLAFTHKSICDLARQFLPSKITKYTSNGTVGEIVFDFSIEDVLNQSMASATKDNTHFVGSIEVNVKIPTNVGNTGTTIFGTYMTEDGEADPHVTEEMLNIRTVEALDMAKSMGFSHVMKPYSNHDVTTMRRWLSFDTDKGVYTLPKETKAVYPRMVLLVKVPISNSFSGEEKKSFYVQLYSRFGPDFRAFTIKPPHTGINLTDSAWVKPKSIKSKFELDALDQPIDAVEIFGKNKHFITDGRQRVRTPVGGIPTTNIFCDPDSEPVVYTVVDDSGDAYMDKTRSISLPADVKQDITAIGDRVDIEVFDAAHGRTKWENVFGEPALTTCQIGYDTKTPYLTNLFLQHTVTLPTVRARLNQDSVAYGPIIGADNIVYPGNLICMQVVDHVKTTYGVDTTVGQPSIMGDEDAINRLITRFGKNKSYELTFADKDFNVVAFKLIYLGHSGILALNPGSGHENIMYAVNRYTSDQLQLIDQVELQPGNFPVYSDTVSFLSRLAKPTLSKDMQPHGAVLGTLGMGALSGGMQAGAQALNTYQQQQYMLEQMKQKFGYDSKLSSQQAQQWLSNQLAMLDANSGALSGLEKLKQHIAFENAAATSPGVRLQEMQQNDNLYRAFKNATGEDGVPLNQMKDWMQTVADQHNKNQQRYNQVAPPKTYDNTPNVMTADANPDTAGGENLPQNGLPEASPQADEINKRLDENNDKRGVPNGILKPEKPYQPPSNARTWQPINNNGQIANSPFALQRAADQSGEGDFLGGLTKMAQQQPIKSMSFTRSGASTSELLPSLATLAQRL